MDRTATASRTMAELERRYERSRLSEEVLAAAYERLVPIARRRTVFPQEHLQTRLVARQPRGLRMKTIHLTTAAIYARVSSEQQAKAATIASQVAALEERVAQDGLTLETELRFLDDGYSGATLVRPALERLRDVAATGAIDRLYVHSPDRLARNYAYQVLLLDEFQRLGMEVAFLNHALGQKPEDTLLLQVQGMVAEYERAKILERSRRGKLHAARQGKVSVFGQSPYGYRYVRREEDGEETRYEIELEEARVVRQMFQWVGALSNYSCVQYVEMRSRMGSNVRVEGSLTWPERGKVHTRSRIGGNTTSRLCSGGR